MAATIEGKQGAEGECVQLLMALDSGSYVYLRLTFGAEGRGNEDRVLGLHFSLPR